MVKPGSSFLINWYLATHASKNFYAIVSLVVLGKPTMYENIPDPSCVVPLALT